MEEKVFSKEEVKKVNQQEIVKVFNDLTEKKVTLIKGKKYLLTVKKFEVFLRLYIDENVQVCIRTNTLNCQEKVNYEFMNYETININDLKKYANDIKSFYRNIIKEALNTFYCPEEHNKMIPDNATKEEIDKGWYKIYEGRLLKELDYNNTKEYETWLKKVSDKIYIEQQG
ncbi:MAG: hypothetical protein IJJ82_07570 [Clostridia bacterium]|nr:hypothetical protein [Clostridia bacterium]